jgi:hypothetical protein
MEKRINKKFEVYITTFKDEIRNKITSLPFDEASKPSMNELLEFVYDYERFSLCKEDLSKRSRIKNAIPANNRCNAKRASGEQCTRRRKSDCEFCGTHTKGTPHGLVTCEGVSQIPLQKVETYAKEICGIVYYIDKFGNVYKTEDILEGRQNPAVVARYKVENDIYTLSDFRFT